MNQDDLAVRKPPTAAVFKLHPQGVRGTCCWCGEPVTEKTEVRGWLRFWHAACELEFQIISRPEVARREVFKRDQGICADCGEDWSCMARFEFIGVCYGDGSSHWGWSTPHGVNLYPLSGLRAVELWHVDHVVPLWKVAHMPALQRIEYFKLANLATRCDPCHKIKSRDEHSDRAHFRKQRNEIAEKPKRPWPKRKMQSRNSFQKRQR